MSDSTPETTSAQVTQQPPSWQVARAITQASLVPWTAPSDSDSRIIFKELTSAKGKKYRIGREIPQDIDKNSWIATHSHLFHPPAPATPHADHTLHPQETTAHISAPPDYYYVNAHVQWPYVKGGGFKRPEESVVRDLHICEYNLDWNSRGWKDYILTIKSDKEAHYAFYDEEGDYYDLGVQVTSWRHWVTYDSLRPNIVKIHAASETPF